MHTPPLFDDEFEFHVSVTAAPLSKLLNAEEMSVYRSLGYEARFVVAHRLLHGDSFARAKQVLYLLSEPQPSTALREVCIPAASASPKLFLVQVSP